MNFGSMGDLFAAAIGFSVVMLLLSLVVTGVCQGIQSMLSLRGRATHAVLREFLRQTGKQEAEADAILKIKAPPPDAGRAVAVAHRAAAWVSGPPRRMVSKQQLAQLALPKEDIDQFDAAVTDWFTRWIKYWTIAISLLVAFGFQVSATQLVQDLSVNSELRAKALEIAATRQQAAAHAVLLEAQSVKDAAKAPLFDEELSKELALLNLGFWREGAAYYRSADGQLEWTNIMGVLLTALFISFGAPFWYEKLKALNVLRDAIYSRGAPRDGSDKTAKENAAPQPPALAAPNRDSMVSGAHRVASAAEEVEAARAAEK
jgi:hypothetical protein